MSKGKILSEKCLWTDAIQCFDKILKTDPNNAEALYQKACVLSKTGEPKGALKCLDKILILFPNHINALCEKGIVLDMLGLRQEAITFFDKSLKINPQHVNSLLQISRILLEQGSTTTNSFRFLKLALSIDPTNSFGLSQLRTHVIYLRNFDEAFAIVENALKTDPKNPQVLATAEFLVFRKNSQKN